MNVVINADVVASAIEQARQTIEENIVYYSQDPAECRACGADFLQGESHRPGCRVDSAERLILESRNARIVRCA